MKKWLAGLFACLLLGLAACAEPAQQIQGADPPDLPSEVAEVSASGRIPTIVDKTVEAASFSMEGYKVQGELSSAADSGVFSTVSDLYENTPYIVYGTTENIAYWDESGTGFTLCDFVIEKSYKGNLESGDKISVLAAGGYYRLSKFIELNGKERFPDLTEEEIQTSVYKTAYMGAPLVEEGEKYLLFLDQITDTPPFPDGVFTETGAFQGRFYYKDEDTLMRYTPENEPGFYNSVEMRSGNQSQEFTLPELEAEIAACAE